MIITVFCIFIPPALTYSVLLLALIFKYLGMDTVQVISTTMSFVGYNSRKHLLMIGFNSGEIYYYSQVPQTIYTKLLQAESKGYFFNAHIKGKYGYRKYT